MIIALIHLKIYDSINRIKTIFDNDVPVCQTTENQGSREYIIKFTRSIVAGESTKDVKMAA